MITWSDCVNTIRTTLEFVYPPLCLGCEVYTEAPYQICGKCTAELDEFNQPFCFHCRHLLPVDEDCPDCREETVRLYTLGHYSNALVDIISQYKFKGITGPSKLFADKLVLVYGDRLRENPQAILHPVPLHPHRERIRGYNQAALLAQALADRLELSYTDELFYRVKKNKPQAKINLVSRKKNVEGVFSVDEDQLPPIDSNIILVDDVVTSGHTLNEAISVLSKAGYNISAVVTIAQAF